MNLTLSLLLLTLANPLSAADSAATEDFWIEGRLGVGTTNPGARFDVLATSSSDSVFRVSGVDETPFIDVRARNQVGIGTFPAANLDISGVADVANVGLELGGGDVYPEDAKQQLLFGYAGQADYRHAWRTVHSTDVGQNRLDMYLWTPAAGDKDDLPSLRVLSLQVRQSTGSQGTMHVNPVAQTPEVELVVSDGSSYGMGILQRAAGMQPSSRAYKSDIRALSAQERRQAYREVGALKHVQFTYKGTAGPRHRGLLFEEAPASLHGPGKTLVLDKRLLTTELALQEMVSRLDALAAELETAK